MTRGLSRSTLLCVPGGTTEAMMIRNVMVRLDGTRADDARPVTMSLACFCCRIPAKGHSVSAARAARLVDKARRERQTRSRAPAATGAAAEAGRVAVVRGARRHDGRDRSMRNPHRRYVRRNAAEWRVTGAEHLVEWVLFGTELHSAVKRFPPVGSCKC